MNNLPKIRVIWILGEHKTGEKRSFFFNLDEVKDKIMEMVMNGWKPTMSPFNPVWFYGTDTDGTIWDKI